MGLFISWSGETSREIAEALKNSIFKYLGISTWVSSVDINAGDAWFNDVIRNCERAEAGIIIVTPATSMKAWQNFEAGMLFAKLKQFEQKEKKLTPILISNENFLVPEPFNHLQWINGRNKEKMIEYLDILAGGRDLKSWFDPHYNSWIDKVDELFKNENRIERSISKFSFLSTIDHKSITQNDVYSQLVFKLLYDMYKAMTELNKEFEVLAEQYPHFLIDLQSKLGVKTKSIASYKRFETFWESALGSQIIDTVSPDSTRIFVYSALEDLLADFKNLVNHAKKYTVKIISEKLLLSRVLNFSKDFSIIYTDDKHKVLAFYDASYYDTNIVFSTKSLKVSEYEQSFRLIEGHSIDFKSTFSPTKEKADEFNKRLFDLSEDILYPEELTSINIKKNKVTPFDQMSIEMSKNFDIDKYHNHEEEHAYYIDMLAFMISKVNKVKPVRIWEVGAGTGLLTKRLCKLPNVEIVALECDGVCFHKLKQTMKGYVGVNTTLVCNDSRIYNPIGDFDYIISSFSDHHIKNEDKFVYLSNMRDNLKEDGIFIVGDEFLRSYNDNDDLDYINALKSYHKHIIDIAEQEGHHVLAGLEKAALVSGIKGRAMESNMSTDQKQLYIKQAIKEFNIDSEYLQFSDQNGSDFKVSTELYEKHMKEIGFTFEKTIIGPTNIGNIGGIYVYTIKKNI